MFNSELRNATQLIREFDAQIKEQRENKKDKLTCIEKNEQSIIISKCN